VICQLSYAIFNTKIKVFTALIKTLWCIENEDILLLLLNCRLPFHPKNIFKEKAITFELLNEYELHCLMKSCHVKIHERLKIWVCHWTTKLDFQSIDNY